MQQAALVLQNCALVQSKPCVLNPVLVSKTHLVQFVMSGLEKNAAMLPSTEGICMLPQVAEQWGCLLKNVHD